MRLSLACVIASFVIGLVQGYLPGGAVAGPPAMETGIFEKGPLKLVWEGSIIRPGDLPESETTERLRAARSSLQVLNGDPSTDEVAEEQFGSEQMKLMRLRREDGARKLGAALDSLENDPALMRELADRYGTWTVYLDATNARLATQFVDSRDTEVLHESMKADKALRIVSANFNPNTTEMAQGGMITRFEGRASVPLQRSASNPQLTSESRTLGLWLGRIDPSWKSMGTIEEMPSRTGTLLRLDVENSPNDWEFQLDRQGRLASAREVFSGTILEEYLLASYSVVDGEALPLVVTRTAFDARTGVVSMVEERELVTKSKCAEDFKWDAWKLHVEANPTLKRKAPDSGL